LLFLAPLCSRQHRDSWPATTTTLLSRPGTSSSVSSSSGLSSSSYYRILLPASDQDRGSSSSDNRSSIKGDRSPTQAAVNTQHGRPGATATEVYSCSVSPANGRDQHCSTLPSPVRAPAVQGRLEQCSRWSFTPLSRTLSSSRCPRQLLRSHRPGVLRLLCCGVIFAELPSCWPVRNYIIRRVAEIN